MFKKENRLALILSSLATLLPMALGLIFWNRLPELMPRHWNIAGQADGFSSKGFVVFGLPLIMLAVHWLCILLTWLDKSNRSQSPKVFRLVLWMIPGLTNILAIFFCLVNSGRQPAMGLMTMFFALLFIILGNYMPKMSRNYSIGIKVKWTLADSENWAATHRFAGRVWVAAGLVMLPCALLPDKYAFPVLLLALIPAALLPVLYSWLFYRKRRSEGRAPARVELPGGKKSTIAAAVITVLVLAAIIPLMFTGNIEYELTETAIVIDADFWQDISVDYGNIDSVEYLENGLSGRRVNGIGSARLLVGLFSNDELGSYTRYSYTGCENAVLLDCGGDLLLLSGRDEEETLSIYRQLLEYIG